MRCNPKRFLFGGGGASAGVSLETVLFITHTHMIQIFSSLFLMFTQLHTYLCRQCELRKREVDSEIITV